jgi:hypothetical protein
VQVQDAGIDPQLGEARHVREQEIAERIATLMCAEVERRQRTGDRLARRDAHPRAHGCVRAEFRVADTLAPQFAHGVFVPGRSYAAWVRFSNASGDARRPDFKGDARGMAIKLLGVPGDKLLSAERSAETQDFVMIDSPIFMLDDPQRYLHLLERMQSTHLVQRALAPLALGVRGALIAQAITARTITSPLDVRYWSTTAYQLGSGVHKQAIKFSVRPAAPPVNPPKKKNAPGYLRETLMRQLRERDYRFDFLVQPRTSPRMSVENSRTEWREAKAPFYSVATLIIPAQEFASAAQDAFGENLAFTPWHALPEHRPLGAINRVRRVVYERVSMFRQRVNGVPHGEPSGAEARLPLGSSQPATSSAATTSATSASPLVPATPDATAAHGTTARAAS